MHIEERLCNYLKLSNCFPYYQDEHILKEIAYVKILSRITVLRLHNVLTHCLGLSDMFFILHVLIQD